jgi:hypothetical protein
VFDSCKYGSEDVIRVGTQLAQGPIAVDALTEVDLADGSESVSQVHVDDEPNLDAVAAGEGEVVERSAADRALAGERLSQGGQLREEAAQQRPSHELVHSSALPGSSVE